MSNQENTPTTAVSDVAKQIKVDETAPNPNVARVVTPAATPVQEPKIEEESTKKEKPENTPTPEEVKKEEKPTEPTPTPSPVVTNTPEPEVQKPANTNQALANIKYAIDNYLKLNDGLLDSHVKRQRVITAFRNIMQAAINEPSYDILNEVYVFFRKNRNRVLHPALALQGIEALPSSVRFRIEIFYMTMFNMVTKEPINMDIVRKDLGEEFATFVARKIKV